MNIGIMGGTFNPIHNGHIAFANQFVNQCSLDCCYIVPAHVSPFKIHSEITDDIHRLHMVTLAFSGIDRVKISDIEIKRAGVSFTIDTIYHFSNIFPDASLFLLIGEDQALQFNQWKEYKKILELVQLVIIARSTNTNKELISQNLKTLESQKYPIWLQSECLDISSTMIRRKILNNEDVSQYLPDSVYQYIQKHLLYTS